MLNDNEQRILTEYLGECWHEWVNGLDPKCTKCGSKDYPPVMFSTWLGFGKLWEAAQKDKEWIEFLNWAHEGLNEIAACDLIEWLIGPDRFATAWAKFKGWEEGE